MPAETCGACKYFERCTEDGETGYCRRYPPQITGADISTHGIVASAFFPVMAIVDWCGEFAQRKPVTLKDLADRKEEG